MRLEERLPRHRLSPERSRFDSVLLEDALDGGAPEVGAQILECAAKPRVPPRRILASHRQKVLHLLTASWQTVSSAPRTTPVVLRGDALAVPPQDRLRRRERRHLGQQLPSKWLSLLGEKSPLGMGEPKTRGAEARAQHAVLGLQELDRLALSATDPAADQQNEEL
jgi:hypothetical protein